MDISDPLEHAEHIVDLFHVIINRLGYYFLTLSRGAFHDQPLNAGQIVSKAIDEPYSSCLPVRGASFHTRASQMRASQFGWQMFGIQEQLGAPTMFFRNRFPYASLQLKLIPMLSQYSYPQSWSMKNK